MTTLAVPGDWMRHTRAAAVRRSIALRAPITPAQPGWRTRAACAGLPASLFHSNNRYTVESARAVCQGCPVMYPCLAATHAAEKTLPRRDTYGVAGSLTPQERWDGRHAPENAGVA